MVDLIIPISATENRIKKMHYDVYIQYVYEIENIIKLLKENNIFIDFINNLGEESVCIEFTINSIYYMIELFIDGVIILMRDNDKISTWNLKRNTYYDKLKEII